MDPVPDEPLPLMSGVFNVPIYGLTRWGDLFNARQKLALLTFADKVRQAHAQMRSQGADPDFAKAVATYLALVISRLADWNSVLSIWRPDQERNEHVFNRQALPMVWDYGERNPCIGDLISTGAIENILAHLTRIPPVEGDSDG
jgi:adenine-specific DNA methylase